MTDKENVLANYPNAVHYRCNYAGLKIHSISIWRGPTQNTEVVIGTDYTEERSWARAWKFLQYEMLEKLEKNYDKQAKG